MSEQTTSAAESKPTVIVGPHSAGTKGLEILACQQELVIRLLTKDVESKDEQINALKVENESLNDVIQQMSNCCVEEKKKLEAENARLTAEVKQWQYYADEAQVDDLEREIVSLKRSRDFYEQRMNALQELQKRLPEPYRTWVCNILANGAATNLGQQALEREKDK